MSLYDASARFGAAAVLLLLVGPLLALLASVQVAGFTEANELVGVADALWLSVWTTTVSLAITVAGGTPLAWMLARSRGAGTMLVRGLIDLGVVLPPAVVGVALLLFFGRQGPLSAFWDAVGWSPAFSAAAVLLAQTMVAAPLYVQSATAGFASVDVDLLDVATSLGASRQRTFFRIAVPLAAPALIGGIALAWARALGEFGATLLFAGNLPGVTQTLPLAIYQALESNLSAASALAAILVALAVAVLVTWRWATRHLGEPQ